MFTVRGGGHSLGGRLAGARQEPVLVLADDHTIHMPPSDHMILLANDDRPGVIGAVGTLLGNAGININDMSVGRAPTGEGASMVIATSQPVPGEVADALVTLDGVMAVRYLGLARTRT